MTFSDLIFCDFGLFIPKIHFLQTNYYKHIYQIFSNLRIRDFWVWVFFGIQIQSASTGTCFLQWCVTFICTLKNNSTINSNCFQGIIENNEKVPIQFINECDYILSRILILNKFSSLSHRPCTFLIFKLKLSKDSIFFSCE